MRASILKISLLALVVAVAAPGQTFAQETDPVTVTRDAQGVWFIEGGTLEEVFEAMGYEVAKDRLWQMDIFRRQGRGTLSALLGPDNIGSDWFLRALDYSDDEYAEMFGSLSVDAQTVISAYTAGVNRRVFEILNGNFMQMPYEYWLLGLQSVLLEGRIGVPVLPQPFTINDIMGIVKLQLREFDPEGQLEVLGRGQLDNAVLAQTLGAVYGLEGLAMFQDLRWFNDPSALTYIPTAGKALSFEPPGLEMAEEIASMPKMANPAAEIRNRADRIIEQMETLGVRPKMGSYAWAISGERTDTGNPMLYSGPQMGFSTPAIISEGSIRGGGLNVSGMNFAGTPGMPIGRTPHHAWSMQVGHAHTMDYYLEPPQAVFLHRMETIEVFGGEPVTVPIWRSSHGPIIEPLQYNPEDPPEIIVSWAYAHWKREAQAIDTMLGLARAESIAEFDAGIEIFPVSQHTTYADVDGNIAYWMSGYDPIRAAGVDPRLPSIGDGTTEWTGERRPRVHDANTAQGFYGGWNNKSRIDYLNAFNNQSYYLGPAHRAQVIADYLAANDSLSFEQVRDLALFIATTDSFGAGGNTWAFVADAFKAAVAAAGPDDDREAAIAMLDAWDGHFVAGGPAEWRFGTLRADAWVLQDEWIKELVRLVMEDEFMMAGLDFGDQRTSVNFQVLLRALAGTNAPLPNLNNWFLDRSGSGKPETANELIVIALDNVLAEIGPGPYNAPRGEIVFVHPIFGEVWRTPFSSRSTYGQVIEFDMNGPLRIESMFPLGQSGEVLPNQFGQPAFNPHFFSMIPVYDPFLHRPFPLFD